MRWSVPPIWEGGDVWILGGGSSVPKQFGIPDDVIQNVVKGISPPSAYSPYMSALHNKHVIGINVAYLIGEWIDMCFFGDGKFFTPHKERLAKWPGLKVTCFKGLEKVPWVKYLLQDAAHSRGISKDPSTVSWNVNSGSAAISVAAHTGAKRIILLGFDMRFNNEGERHWHHLYKGVSSEPPIIKGRRRATNPPFDFSRHLRGFPQIAEDARKMGIEILNASPDSAITQFPKFTVKELLFDNS